MRCIPLTHKGHSSRLDHAPSALQALEKVCWCVALNNIAGIELLSWIHEAIRNCTSLCDSTSNRIAAHHRHSFPCSLNIASRKICCALHILLPVIVSPHNYITRGPWSLYILSEPSLPAFSLHHDYQLASQDSGPFPAGDSHKISFPQASIAK